MIKELNFEDMLLPIYEDGEIVDYKDIVVEAEWEWVDDYNFGGEREGQRLKLKRVSWVDYGYSAEESRLLKGWTRINWDMIEEEALCD